MSLWEEVYYKALAHTVKKADSPRSTVGQLGTQESCWCSSGPRMKA